MDKKRIELIITLGLVIIFIFVLAVNLKPKKPKQKLSPSSKISEKEKEASISKKKIEKILRASPQEIEKQKNRAQLSWGRDPFFSSFLVKKEVSKTTSLTLKGVTIGKDKKGYAFINLGIDDESIKVTSYSDAEKFINYYFDYYKNHSTFEGRYYFERALDCFSDAKNSRPEDPEIRFYYSALGFYCPTGPDPIKSFNETISIIENIPPYKKKEPIIKTLKRCAWYAMGKAYKEIGQEAKAKECLRKANETE